MNLHQRLTLGRRSNIYIHTQTHPEKLDSNNALKAIKLTHILALSRR